MGVVLGPIGLLDQRHLLHALREFEQFYNGHRPHQGIANARPLCPLPTPIADRTRSPTSTYEDAIASAASSTVRACCLTCTDQVFGKSRVDRRENLCVCGPSGTGKAHLCEALGQLAIDTGRTVAWFSIDALGALVRRDRADDSISKAIRRITHVDLIIVDDIGMLAVGDDPRGVLPPGRRCYETARWRCRATFTRPDSTLMPKTLATATVDRLLHHAHICVTEGQSFRLAQATTGKGVTPLPT